MDRVIAAIRCAIRAVPSAYTLTLQCVRIACIISTIVVLCPYEIHLVTESLLFCWCVRFGSGYVVRGWCADVDERRPIRTTRALMWSHIALRVTKLYVAARTQAYGLCRVLTDPCRNETDTADKNGKEEEGLHVARELREREKANEHETVSLFLELTMESTTSQIYFGLINLASQCSGSYDLCDPEHACGLPP